MEKFEVISESLFEINETKQEVAAKQFWLSRKMKRESQECWDWYHSNKDDPEHADEAIAERDCAILREELAEHYADKARRTLAGEMN